MNDPIVKLNKSNEDGFNFTLSNVNVSIANGIRRTILTDIPVIGFDKSKCNIEINTTQFINEIIKHRLTCIPIMLDHYDNENLEDILPNQYTMELDIENTQNEELLVTTNDFILINKETGNKVSKNELNKIFPKNAITGDYITFLRLRPKLSDNIPGQAIKLKCDFSVFTSREDSVYVPVSKCTYFNTIDEKEAKIQWEKYKVDFMKQYEETTDNKKDSKNELNEELKFEKKNFDALEIYRHFKKDSFEFTIKSVSFYTDIQLIKNACSIIIQRLEKFINNILNINVDNNDGDDNDEKQTEQHHPLITIKLSHEVIDFPSTMENSYDIMMIGEDYTLGNILQHILYDSFYIVEKTIIYCGFQKYHPHNNQSVLRIAYIKPITHDILIDNLKTTVNKGIDIFKKIQKAISH
jgi:DNA-directed RNA polymerase subunit L